MVIAERGGFGGVRGVYAGRGRYKDVGKGKDIGMEMSEGLVGVELRGRSF